MTVVSGPTPESENPQSLAEASSSRMWASDSASQLLGMQLQEVAPGRAVLQMRVTAAMINGHGICHGGYIFTLADSAFAVACNTYGGAVVAAGADVNFMSPARVGEELVAVATERFRRGRGGLYDVTVKQCPEGRVVAEFRGRSRSLPAATQQPGSAGTE
ncbi:MAG: hydroxyphenylacetyl-CoA thioesterase PaaI [Candidatus Dormibacteria bacterium]